ncbi:hypothetical protein HPB47_027439 [Ixodes persulcatus]|uniref:Uncharacterized protein n=1 Tax=Ixodes persulcatus TaxID=34615 RepID=A0AC60PVT5_IXOPE|nr:hypothetical protein HPB47_027439 [Ixodes persulcatus]
MPSKRAKSCFVPNCNSGYQSCKEKVPLFRTPKEAERLEAWSRNIKRADRTLDSTCVVCAKHSEEQYIEKTSKHIVNGEIVQIQRDRPLLRDDAAPTIFPDAPSYFTRSLPKKRKTRDLCHQLLPPCKRKKQEEICEAVDIQGEERSSTATQRSGTSQFYSNLHLLTSHWSKIVFEEDPLSAHYAWCEPGSNSHVKTTKLVTFCSLSGENTARCCVYLRAVKIIDIEVHTSAEAEAQLMSAENSAMCPGATLKPLVGKNYVTFGNKYFSKDCTGCPQDGQPCLRCRYLKKLIQNHMSRKRKKTSSSTKKQSRRRHALLKAKKKLLVARKTIEQLQAQINSLPSTIIQERLAGLPPKQRAAVTCCFDAASRKSRQGMKYDKSWILECILMRMRSPKLYEHIRKQNIFALPSKSCHTWL